MLFLHLSDYPACEKVLPSKLFEYAAMGKPVRRTAFLAKYARATIMQEIAADIARLLPPAGVQQAVGA